MFRASWHSVYKMCSDHDAALGNQAEPFKPCTVSGPNPCNLIEKRQSLGKLEKKQ